MSCTVKVSGNSVPAGATTATTYDYGYARTAHSSPTAYDAKAYYQQQATPATPVTPAYSTSDYQTAGNKLLSLCLHSFVNSVFLAILNFHFSQISFDFYDPLQNLQ